MDPCTKAETNCAGSKKDDEDCGERSGRLRGLARLRSGGGQFRLEVLDLLLGLPELLTRWGPDGSGGGEGAQDVVWGGGESPQSPERLFL